MDEICLEAKGCKCNIILILFLKNQHIILYHESMSIYDLFVYALNHVLCYGTTARAEGSLQSNNFT